MKNLITAFIIIICGISLKAQESKIIGNWQLTQIEANGQTETKIKLVFIFVENGVFKLARDANSKTIDVGSWKYNKEQQAIIMASDLDKDFRGNAEILKITKSKLVYKKESAIWTFSKLAKMNPPAKVTMEKPILPFKSDDMYDEEGNFNYEEAEAKLPWTIETIVNFLKNYTELVYNITSFPDEQEAEAWIVSEKINYNEAEQTIDVRSYSYFQNDYIDMMEDPILINNLTEYEYDFMFFPQDNLDIYKVVGTETIATPAGTFECTLVEGFGRFNSKVQYWMVNNKPGVFAKVVSVKDAPTPFGNTKVYVLKEIK
ncbi:hypothetical protein MHL31_12130 [Lutibacter sp. A80]|uniref:hypothetical protein n=1 Tax=Lutibacter sp. A80 TaxID=2918453 RepID=UPI001F059896|nr:hypothetical protein [Lutibacter sp. A80]UMB59822.1 hypothetical protein MHL31_12130 [Lutibacter sp. A80]